MLKQAFSPAMLAGARQMMRGAGQVGVAAINKIPTRPFGINIKDPIRGAAGSVYGAGQAANRGVRAMGDDALYTLGNSRFNHLPGALGPTMGPAFKNVMRPALGAIPTSGRAFNPAAQYNQGMRAGAVGGGLAAAGGALGGGYLLSR